MSLFSEYKLELENKPVIETEHGFACYGIHGTDCYIEDIYVKPEFRKTHEASHLANMVLEDARLKGCKRLFGSVVPSRHGATISMKVQLAYGFRVFSASENFILLVKDIV